MWKWRKWILLVIIVAIVGFTLFLYYSFFIHPKTDKQMLRNAEAAVGLGITIEDQQDDIVSLKGKEDEPGKFNNPQSYTSPYLDVKSIGVGADDQYLYYKVQYWGQIPKKAERIGDDVIRGNMMKLNILNKQGQDQAILVTNYGWSLFNLSGLETYYFYGSTGIVEPEDKQFAHQKRDSKVFGGPGTDYLIGAFPLDTLDLKQGQTMYLNFLGEAKSNKFDHASIDALRGKGKMAGFITWNVGSSQYQIDDNYFR